MHPKGLSAMTDWTRVFNDVTVAIGVARSRTAVLFTVVGTKSAMGLFSPACQASREYDRHVIGWMGEGISLTLSGS